MDFCIFLLGLRFLYYDCVPKFMYIIVQLIPTSPINFQFTSSESRNIATFYYLVLGTI